LGLPMDKAKGLELLTRAADLGYGHASCTLGNLLEEGWKYGVSYDKLKARQYFERAAELGHVGALLKLGLLEQKNDNYRAAIKHWRIAAAMGDEIAVANLISCFEGEKLLHNDLANCLQTKDKACLDMKSEQRTEFEKYVEEFGNAEDGYKYWSDRIALAKSKGEAQ